MMLIITHLMIITDDDDNDSLLHIADFLLLIDKNDKLIVDMSTISSWNNSRQCYLTLDVFRSDTMLDDDGDNDDNDDADYVRWWQVIRHHELIQKVAYYFTMMTKITTMMTMMTMMTMILMIILLISAGRTNFETHWVVCIKSGSGSLLNVHCAECSVEDRPVYCMSLYANSVEHKVVCWMFKCAALQCEYCRSEYLANAYWARSSSITRSLTNASLVQSDCVHCAEFAGSAKSNPRHTSSSSTHETWNTDAHACLPPCNRTMDPST